MLLLIPLLLLLLLHLTALSAMVLVSVMALAVPSHVSLSVRPLVGPLVRWSHFRISSLPEFPVAVYWVVVAAAVVVVVVATVVVVHVEEATLEQMRR